MKVLCCALLLALLGILTGATPQIHPPRAGSYVVRLGSGVTVKVTLTPSKKGNFTVSGRIGLGFSESVPISGTLFGSTRKLAAKYTLGGREEKLDGYWSRLEGTVVIRDPHSKQDIAARRLRSQQELAKAWTGKWSLGMKDNVSGKRDVILSLSCNGKTASGSYPLWYGGKVTGEVQPDGSIRGQWTNSYKGGDGGTFDMSLSSDGKSWSGSWTGRYDSGTWKGRRLQ